MIKEELYVSPEYEDLADVESKIEYYDATTLRIYATCPRQYQYKVCLGLANSTNKPRPMLAGIAMHTALDVYTISGSEELAIEAFREDWGDNDATPVISKFAHLTAQHLEIVLKNYFDFAKEIVGLQYTPVTYKRSELNFDKVVAAKLRLLDDDTVLLGESSWLMDLPVPGTGVRMYYSGKPDMIVRGPANNIYIMDHKTTSSYLSDWNMEQHRVSNQLRCYMGMLRELLGYCPHGGLVNGIFVGAKASSDAFKGQRFRRFKYNWMSEHVDEALHNQYEWVRKVKDDTLMDYFPQVGNIACRGCDMGKLCDVEPDLRTGVEYTDYEAVGWRNFFDL